MAILVTGGAGYIGSHMVYELLDRGEKVVVLDNLSTGDAALLPKDVPLIVAGITDAARLRGTLLEHKIESVIHLAGSVVVTESVTDPLSYYGNNTEGARALVETALSVGVYNVIFSSSAAVYGEGNGAPIDEAFPPAPTSPYGMSKWMAEIMLRDVARVTDLRYIAMRYFNVAGADPKGRTGQITRAPTHLIKVVCQVALGIRPVLEVFGTDYPTQDGTCIRDYIHVSDLCRAHYAALVRLRTQRESLVLNCGYGHGYSVKQVVEVAKQVSGMNFEVRYAPRRAGDPAQVVARVDKIRHLLQWAPQFDNLPRIVEDALAWERTLSSRG